MNFVWFSVAGAGAIALVASIVGARHPFIPAVGDARLPVLQQTALVVVRRALAADATRQPARGHRRRPCDRLVGR